MTVFTTPQEEFKVAPLNTPIGSKAPKYVFNEEGRGIFLLQPSALYHHNKREHHPLFSPRSAAGQKNPSEATLKKHQNS